MLINPDLCSLSYAFSSIPPAHKHFCRDRAVDVVCLMQLGLAFWDMAFVRLGSKVRTCFSKGKGKGVTKPCPDTEKTYTLWKDGGRKT